MNNILENSAVGKAEGVGDSVDMNSENAHSRKRGYRRVFYKLFTPNDLPFARGSARFDFRRESPSKQGVAGASPAGPMEWHRWVEKGCPILV